MKLGVSVETLLGYGMNFVFKFKKVFERGVDHGRGMFLNLHLKFFFTRESNLGMK